MFITAVSVFSEGKTRPDVRIYLCFQCFETNGRNR